MLPADVLLRAADLIDPPPDPLETQRDRWWADPVAYCRERFDIEPTVDQRNVLEGLRDHRRVAVVAANGVGKTWVESVVVTWFMECAPRQLHDGTPTEPIAYTTAPTFRQVVNNLWKEIRSRHAAATPPLPGNLLPKDPRWDLSHASFAQGLSATDEESIKGQHAPYLLIAVDEAQGVRASVFDGIETMIKGRHARLLLVLNASQVAGPAYDAFHDQAGLWHTFRISASTHPNVVAGLNLLGIDWDTWRAAPYNTHPLPDDFHDPIPGAVSLIDLDELKIRYGVGTPAWQVVVEGEFPSASDRTLIWLPWVDAAFDTDPEARDPQPLPQHLQPLDGRWAGLDVARFGSDRSCLVKVDGGRVVSVETWQGHELSYTAGRAHQAIRDGYTLVYDEGGLGAGITSHLQQDGIRIGDQAHPCNAGSSSTSPNDFPKMRDQLWCTAADYLRLGHLDMTALPRDVFQTLKGELTAVEYDLDSRSRRTVESKDELKKRIGRSPDLADALCLALHRPARTVSRVRVHTTRNDFYDRRW